MHVGILIQQPGPHFQALCQAFTARGVETEAFTVADLAGGVGMSTPKRNPLNMDAFIQRGMPMGSLEQIIFRMDALYSMENRGVVFLNSPKAMERTVDKFYTSFLLAHNGIPTPQTLATESANEAMEAFRQMGCNGVTKPLFGSCGKGMLHLETQEAAQAAFEEMERQQRVIYLQQFIPCRNQDVRILVLGGRIVAAMRREGADWRANLALGGRAFAYAPSREETELALAAARTVGADCAGVDLLLPETGGVLVCEVNGSPGFLGLQQVTKKDIPGEMAEYLINKTQNMCQHKCAKI